MCIWKTLHIFNLDNGNHLIFDLLRGNNMSASISKNMKMFCVSCQRFLQRCNVRRFSDGRGYESTMKVLLIPWSLYNCKTDGLSLRCVVDYHSWIVWHFSADYNDLILKINMVRKLTGYNTKLLFGGLNGGRVCTCVLLLQKFPKLFSFLPVPDSLSRYILTIKNTFVREMQLKAI